MVKVRDKVMKPSPKEYDLMRAMVQHAGKLLTHKFLLNELWAVPIDAPACRIDAWPNVRLWHKADMLNVLTNADVTRCLLLIQSGHLGGGRGVR